MITWKPTQWHQILTRLSRSRRLTRAEQDACARALDSNSELASTVEESQDFVESLVSASGAPDGESLLKRIGELRALAAERDRLAEELEHPIPFSAPMVRALLEGRKTQTRRVIRAPFVIDEHPETGQRWPLVPSYCNDGDDDGKPIHCPYGQPGDRLWVRETWKYADWTEDGMPFVAYAADNSARIVEAVPAEFASKLETTWEVLSRPENYAIEDKASDQSWRSPVTMPRWASRIILEVVSVRVERLQDISEADALAEGIADTRAVWDGVRGSCGGPRESFRTLWDSTSKHPWASNPWVWVIGFEVRS